MGNYLGNLNHLTADNMVNPQIYGAMYDKEANPLLANYHNQLTGLNNDLAAKNLTGGSYDAYAHHLLNQDTGLQLSQASNNATLGGLQATGDYLGLMGNGATAAGNQMTSLGNMAGQYQDLSSQLQSQLMNPFQQYGQYQSAINPLQEQLGKYYASQPTGMQKIGSVMSAAAPFANFIPGVGPAVSAGLQVGGKALGAFGSNGQ